jgi:hypothetical protein
VRDFVVLDVNGVQGESRAAGAHRDHQRVDRFDDPGGASLAGASVCTARH